MAFKSEDYTEPSRKTGKQSFRVGYVAIVGRPNVGKSTLMNAFLRQKLAIVTPKPQTTRHRILGILSEDNHQVIFLDTPGLVRPKYLLQETLVKTVKMTMKEADLILMMVAATGLDPEDDECIQSLKKFNTPRFLLINKADLVAKENILPIIDHHRTSGLFREIVPISALKEDGLDLLLSLILKSLPVGVPFYPPDKISDEPERFFASEIIREQVFLHYGEEIPYATTVYVDEFRENPGQKDYIKAVIVVERNSQKGILIGKGGNALKRVGRAAREGIELLTGRPTFLELNVQVRKNWRKDAALLKRLGYR
ncbi:MAG: GTPase Era [bacterium]